jgi:cobalt-zinc-cadmium resistance protein CzcA
VIVGGLLANLIIGVFLLPTLYVWVARDNDILPEVESTEDY